MNQLNIIQILHSRFDAKHIFLKSYKKKNIKYKIKQKNYENYINIIIKS